MNGLGRPSVRAVVYTRKSSEEGLDQEFNSLDAQYEACTAYIASQRHEGWKLVKQRFDDGGVSGGTMDRLVRCKGYNLTHRYHLHNHPIGLLTRHPLAHPKCQPSSEHGYHTHAGVFYLRRFRQRLFHLYGQTYHALLIGDQYPLS
jgi:hypothetical protein